MREASHINDTRRIGARLADGVAAAMGSWRFIIIQTIIVLAWISCNVVAIAFRFDPYPFILLNLAFSTQAAYSAPIIMLSQNRQAEVDRAHAEAAYAHLDELLAMQRAQTHALAHLVNRGNEQHRQIIAKLNSLLGISEGRP